MLIDTHCHVHVAYEPPAREVMAGCCGHQHNNSDNDSKSNSSLAQAEAAAGNGDLRPDNLVSSSNERASGWQEQRTSLQALPRVVQITMGIREEDWSRAISLAPAWGEDVPHYEQLLLPLPPSALGEERGKACDANGAAAGAAAAAGGGGGGTVAGAAGVDDAVGAGAAYDVDGVSGGAAAAACDAAYGVNAVGASSDACVDAISAAAADDDAAGGTTAASPAPAPFFHFGIGLHPW